MEYLNVNFLGSEIMVINHDGEPYVAMHTVVNGMGLTWQPQHRKLTSNQRWGVIKMMIPTNGDTQDACCIPLRKLFGWLLSINPNKVPESKRQTIIRYQEECDEVLWQYWTNGIANREKILQEMELLKKQQAESVARGSAAGKALYQRKLEKRQLEQQLVAINQLDLFKQTA